MKVLLLYRPRTDQEGIAEDYCKNFMSRHPEKRVEQLSLDTQKGDDIAKLYDIVRSPAILITSDDGRLVQLWQDQPLPLVDEVFGYLT